MTNENQLVYTDSNALIPENYLPKQSKFFITIGKNDDNADFNTADYNNDTLAIQAASNFVRDSGGGTLFFKKGTYIINSSIIIAPNIHYTGEGRKSVLDGSTMPIPEDLTSPHQNKYPIFKSTNDLGKGEFYFEKLSFKGRFNYGTTSYCDFTKDGVSGIVVNKCERVVINACYFEKCWYASELGIDATSNYTLQNQGGENIGTYLCTNNYCYDCVNGLQGYDCKNMIYDSNYFKLMGDDCCTLLTSTGKASKATCVGNILEEGSTLNPFGQPGRAQLFKIDGGTSNNCLEATVVGNIAVNPLNGIQIQSGGVAILQGNIIKGAYESGIMLFGGNDKIVISDNILIDCNKNNDSAKSYITIGTPSNIISITGNHFYGSNRTSEQGIKIPGNPTNVSKVFIRDNYFENIGSRVIYAYATHVTAENNVFYAGTNTSNSIQFDRVEGIANVSGNHFYGAVTARHLDLLNTKNIKCSDNVFYECNIPLRAIYNSNNNLDFLEITRNKITNSIGSTTNEQSALLVDFASTGAAKTIIVSGNTVTDNDSTYYRGINIQSTQTVSSLTFSNNVVNNNKFGVRINGTFTNAVITGNNFSGNVVNQSVITGATFTNSASVGNLGI